MIFYEASPVKMTAKAFLLAKIRQFPKYKKLLSIILYEKFANIATFA